MRKPRCSRRGSISKASVIAMIFFALALAPELAAAEGPLQLEVLINGQPIGLIGSFHQDARGKLSAKRAELEELHLKVPDRFEPQDNVALADLPGVSYRYDEAGQTIEIAVTEDARLPKIYDLRSPGERAAAAPSETGVVLNYFLYAGGGNTGNVITNWQFQGLSASLDARCFSPYGVVSQTGILSTRGNDSFVSRDLRLDSTWTYMDPENVLTYRAGDTISGGFAWTRPVRLGGIQVQRDFGIRPDLVTLPLPGYSGSAAVPSTADIFVNGVRMVSQDVESGPFRLTNLPVLAGQGEASVIVRDSSGRAVETALPFVVSSKLLRDGLFDFSAEAGFPRLFYGSQSNVYAGAFAGSASVRYGFSDRLTLQAHAEGTKLLANGGIGAVLGMDRAGVVSAAFAGSMSNGAPGWLAFAAFDTTLFGLTFSASTLRTFGRYNDLAATTARPFGFSPGGSAFSTFTFAPGFFSKILCFPCGRPESRTKCRSACLFRSSEVRSILPTFAKRIRLAIASAF